MTGEVKRGSKKRIPIKSISLILSFLALIYIVLAILTGSPMLFLSGLDSIFSRNSAKMANEYFFDIGRARSFAAFDSAVASVGTLGLQVLDADGNETLRDSFRMANPTIAVQNGRAVAYDIGGSAVRVFIEDEIIASLETSGTILSVSMNRNGWIAVCTQDGGINKGSVIVYDSEGRPEYKVSLVSGYVLCAALSEDNRYLAILNLTDSGSRIALYSLNSENVDRVLDFPDTVILDIRYLSAGEILAVSTRSLFLLDRRNETKLLYDFSERRLGGFEIGSAFAALHLLDHSVGHQGQLVVVDFSGRVSGRIDVDREIISMSPGNGYLAVLRIDGLVFYDTSLRTLPVSEEPASTAATTGVLALGNGAALVTNDHSAVTYRSR